MLNKLRCCALSNSLFVLYHIIPFSAPYHCGSHLSACDDFFLYNIYLCISPPCFTYERKQNFYLRFSNFKLTFEIFPSIRIIIYAHCYIYSRFIYTLLFRCGSPLCAWCINACCRNWIFPLVLRGKCVLHNAWIKTFYVLSDSGVRKGGQWRVVCRGGSVCNPRKENAAACYERVHCRRRRRASSQRHQSSASVLLLFTRRRRLRSSRDESFVGYTLVPVFWYPGLRLYHLIPLPFPL